MTIASELTVDQMIAITVRALAAARNERIEDVARAISITRTSLYNKLSGIAPFKASEVALLADHFGRSVGDFYDGLGGRLAGGPGPMSTLVGRTQAWGH
jgi:hypothetical protein